VQNFTQNDLTEVKIFQSFLGATFFETPCSAFCGWVTWSLVILTFTSLDARTLLQTVTAVASYIESNRLE